MSNEEDSDTFVLTPEVSMHDNFFMIQAISFIAIFPQIAAEIKTLWTTDAGIMEVLHTTERYDSLLIFVQRHTNVAENFTLLNRLHIISTALIEFLTQITFQPMMTFCVAVV